MERQTFGVWALALLLATVVLPSLTLGVATPQPPSSNADAAAVGIDSTCTKPYVRKEWRRLTIDERKSYIAAVKCMMAKPGVAPLEAVTNRFEDFLATHIVQALESHFVGIFYPYHRFLLSRYEQELWECGWSRDLGQPFWDWTLDTEHDEDLINSPVFDVVTGFGGNGGWIGGNFTHPAPGMTSPTAPAAAASRTAPSRTCPPFSAPKTTRPSPPTAPATACAATWPPVSLRKMSGKQRVAEAMDLPDYGSWERVTDGVSLHPGGHWGPGGLYGTMTDLFASPGDPVFWLHHSNLDRAWWSWQSRDAARVYDISGPLVFFDYGNKAAGNVTLGSTVWNGLGDFRKETTVEKVMHIQRGELCYIYDELY
ncbi:Tyrosinase-like protein orsC [Apiospora saccharicola]